MNMYHQLNCLFTHVSDHIPDPCNTNTNTNSIQSNTNSTLRPGFTSPPRSSVWIEDPLRFPQTGWWHEYHGLSKSGQNRCNRSKAEINYLLAGVYHFQQLVRLINEEVKERTEELDNLWSLLRDYVAAPNLGLRSLQVPAT